MELKDLQIIILDCPYRTWENKSTQALFTKIISLKLNDYQRSYNSKIIMPIDTSDFLATHLLVCSKINGEWVPVMGFKSMDLKRCQEFKLTFPALSLAQAAVGGERLVPYVKHAMKECQNKKIPLFYISAWAIDPDIRQYNKILTQQLTSLFAGLVWLQHHQYNPLQILAAASIQFRVDHLLKLLGFYVGQHEGTELPSYGVGALCETRAFLTELRNFTPYAAQLAQKYQALWDERIVIPKSL